MCRKVILIGCSGNGDYLDMVAEYPTRGYIAYPCGQSEYGDPTGACMAQVDPRIVK